MGLKKFVANRWAIGFFTATVITTGTVGVASLANDTETTPIVEEVEEPTPIVEEPKEEITFEYYTITEEAINNGWTCHTIDRCDKNQTMVYIYDPARLGQHKFNVVAGFRFTQADFTVVFVDKYNQVLETKTYTVDSDGLNNGGFALVISDYPAGTKYVKFADLNNFITP